MHNRHGLDWLWVSWLRLCNNLLAAVGEDLLVFDLGRDGGAWLVELEDCWERGLVLLLICDVHDVRVASLLLLGLARGTEELEVAGGPAAIVDVLKDDELLFDIVLLEVGNAALGIGLEVLLRLHSLKRGRLLLRTTVKALHRLFSIQAFGVMTALSKGLSLSAFARNSVGLLLQAIDAHDLASGERFPCRGLYDNASWVLVRSCPFLALRY